VKFSEFLLTLKQFLDSTGMTQKDLAQASGIHASQISEWLNGRRGVRMGKNANHVLKYIREYYKRGEIPLPSEIELAIRKVWNGDPKRATIIVNLLESVEPAFQ